MSQFRMLDLFSGLGGASSAMRRRKWDTLRVDIDSRFRPDICADLASWSYEGPPVDLLWASPPCVEYSREDQPWARQGIVPDNTLIRATHRLILEIQPRYWIIENVRGAQRWWGKACWHSGPIYLWGYFPSFRCHVPYWKEHLSGKDREKRAKIPYMLSREIALTIERGESCV